MSDVDSRVMAKRRLMSAINRFKRASVERSWIGSKLATERPDIIREHKLAREHLDKVIDEVIHG